MIQNFELPLNEILQTTLNRHTAKDWWPPLNVKVDQWRVGNPYVSANCSLQRVKIERILQIWQFTNIRSGLDICNSTVSNQCYHKSQHFIGPNYGTLSDYKCRFANVRGKWLGGWEFSNSTRGINSLGHEFAEVEFLDHDGLRHDEHNENVLRQNFDYNSKVVI